MGKTEGRMKIMTVTEDYISRVYPKDNTTPSDFVRLDLLKGNARINLFTVAHHGLE